MVHERRTRRADAGEFARGPDRRRCGCTFRARIAVPREKTLRGGRQQVDVTRAIRTRVLLRVSQQGQALACSTSFGCHHQRSQQRHFGKQLETDESRRRIRRAGKEKIFTVRGSKVFRRQLRAAQQRDRRFQRGLRRNAQLVHVQAADLRRAGLTPRAGTQLASQLPLLPAQQLSVRYPTSSFMTPKSAL